MAVAFFKLPSSLCIKILFHFTTGLRLGRNGQQRKFTLIIFGTQYHSLADNATYSARSKVGNEAHLFAHKFFGIKMCGDTRYNGASFESVIYFELQKDKWKINKEARNKFKKEKGEKLTDEEYIQLINEIADAKIKIAILEKSSLEKYLKIIPARKIRKVQYAEEHGRRTEAKRMP